MNYDSLIGGMHLNKISYESLLYANAVLSKHLTDLSCKDCLEQNQFILTVKASDTKGSIFTSEKIIENIKFFGRIEGKNFLEAEEVVRGRNAHFIRARVLNAVVELIKKYYEGSDKWFQLHELEWFQVLYVLRNIASHADNYNNKIIFPKRTPNSWKKLKKAYPDKIQWKGIEIENGHIGNIRYNDEEILELLDYVIQFFSLNFKTWEIT